MSQQPPYGHHAPRATPPQPAKSRRWPWVLGIFAAFVVGTGVGGASAREAAVPVAPVAPSSQAAAAEPEPQHEAGTIPQGEWIVGDEVAPGRYRSAGAVQGLFELCSVFVNDAKGNVIDLSTGNAGEQVLITIPKNAASVQNSGCEPFRPVG